MSDVKSHAYVSSLRSQIGQFSHAMAESEAINADLREQLAVLRLELAAAQAEIESARKAAPNAPAQADPAQTSPD